MAEEVKPKATGEPEATGKETPKQEAKTPEPVPYGRFQEVVQERNEMKSRLDALETAQKAAEEKQLTEQNKWKELAERREAELKKERSERLRLTVATSKGLPPELAARLQGETQEELEADADSLLAFVKQPESKGVPLTKSGGKTTRLDIKSMTPEEIRKNKAALLQQQQ